MKAVVVIFPFRFLSLSKIVSSKAFSLIEPYIDDGYLCEFRDQLDTFWVKPEKGDADREFFFKNFLKSYQKVPDTGKTPVGFQLAQESLRILSFQ
jgi:hypothetical protein